jgi:ssDNA-binding replication factor A large subunit
LISDLTVKSRSVNVRFKALEIEKPRRVTSRSSGRSHQVANCVVGDESAVITLTLWNYDVDEIEIGKSFELVNGYVNTYDECMRLGRGRWGEFRDSPSDIASVNRGLDMSRPFMGRPKRPVRKRSQTGRTFSGTAGRESRGYPSRKGF